MLALSENVELEENFERHFIDISGNITLVVNNITLPVIDTRL